MEDSFGKVRDYEEKGYHVEHLDDHVKGFGETLMKFKLSEEEIDRVRESGYKISSRFWVNIALMSAKDKNKIVVTGLRDKDCKIPFSKIV